MWPPFVVSVLSVEMTEWMPLQDLEARLAQVGPIGLHLRGMFHGRLGIPFVTLFGRQPDITEVEGLGDVQVWAGVVDDVPFLVTGQMRGELTGFEISFPTRVVDHRIDISLLDCVAAIAPEFRGLRYTHVEGLPFVGDGYAVIRDGQPDPVFRSSERADAEAVLRFLVDKRRYSVEKCRPAPVQWMVTGPRVGSTISVLQLAENREEAIAMQLRWSAENGVDFAVHEGQLQG